jgi:hypothetical protein
VLLLAVDVRHLISLRMAANWGIRPESGSALLPRDERETAARPMKSAIQVRTVAHMARNGYLERLRHVPAFRHCTRRQLEEVARLVDVVELPAGTVELDRRELVVTLDPVRALVVGRQALPVLLELAPQLVTEPQEEVAWRAGSTTPALRLHPA